MNSLEAVNYVGSLFLFYLYLRPICIPELSSVGLERFLDREEVTGSNPVVPTYFFTTLNFTKMKLLLTPILSLLLICAVQAQKTKVTSGTLDFLKNAKNVHLTYSYDDLKVGKMSETDYIKKRVADAEKREAGSGAKWEESWKGDRSRSYQPFFETKINETVKTIRFSPEDQGDYNLNVATSFIEPGFNVGVASKSAYINLVFTFTDQAGNALATIDMQKVPGRDAVGADFDTSWRISEAYEKAAKELGKLINKAID